MAQPFEFTPVIEYDQQMRAGERYLMSIDFQHDGDPAEFGSSEEVVLRCMLHTAPLFMNQPINGGAVILHRYGGSYGPAQFVLTARRTPGKGSIIVNLINEYGVPIGNIVLRDIEVLANAPLPNATVTIPSVGGDRVPTADAPVIALGYSGAEHDQAIAARIAICCRKRATVST